MKEENWKEQYDELKARYDELRALAIAREE